MNENNCLVCNRINLIKEGNNPYFVRELETGYVVIGDHQTYYGYTLFLCKDHKIELHQLPQSFKEKFLKEMSLVAEAVFNTFNPDKMNYELLGNTDEHMHWHLFPRRKKDAKPGTAIWAVDKADRSKVPTDDELKEMKKQLAAEIDRLLG